MAASENGPRVGCRKVSGKSRAAAAAAIAAKTTSRMKLERQPNAVCSAPPITGATMGANAVIDPISDNSRPARTPE